MLDFDPNREGVLPVPAATVIIGREAQGELEVFCVKRHQKSGFLGGAVVFPGGKVDQGDLSASWQGCHTPLALRSSVLGKDALGFAVAALRETLEEAAILPIVGDPLSAQAALELRAELARRTGDSPEQARHAGDVFRMLIQERGWVLDTARLVPLWRWTTPKAEKRRFETPFYWLDLPPGQVGESDQHETTQGFWSTPKRLLERWVAGEIFLAPPTSRSLELLAELTSPDEVAALAERHSLDPICPELVFEGQTTILALPGDPLHSLAEPIGGSEDGPTRFVLEDGRFVGRRVD